MHRSRIFPGRWTFNPTEAQMARSKGPRPLLTELDSTGKPATLITGRAVLCPNIEQCEGNYPTFADSPGVWWIPLTVCRKCQYHNQRGRFVLCQYAAPTPEHPEAAGA